MELRPMTPQELERLQSLMRSTVWPKPLADAYKKVMDDLQAAAALAEKNGEVPKNELTRIVLGHREIDALAERWARGEFDNEEMVPRFPSR